MRGIPIEGSVMELGIKEQYKYNDAYQKENIQRVVVKFNRKNERDLKILDHLQKEKQKKGGDSIQEYIKKAVEDKMNK